MGKESVGMKEDERERISEMDVDGLTKHNKLLNEFSLAHLSTSKGGRPPPFYRDWRGPQPSVFLFSPSLLFLW